MPWPSPCCKIRLRRARSPVNFCSELQPTFCRRLMQEGNTVPDGGRALQHCLFCLCIHVVWRVKRADPKVERIDTMCGIINALDEGKLRVALEGKRYVVP